MAEWVVSLHGGGGASEASEAPSMVVLEGVTVYFYASEGAELPDRLAWPLFHLLMGDPEQVRYARSLAVEVYGPGSAVVDYTLTGSDGWADEFGSACGVFEAGSRFGPNSWVLTSGHVFTLSWLLTQCAPGDALHWLACRALSWPAWCAARRGGR